MSTERIISVLKAPHISEKSARLQEYNQYVFLVAQDATKKDVKTAIEQMFEVKVENVNLANVRGKQKMFRFRAGRRSGTRKAYVRLAEGHGIDVMAKA